MSNNDDQLVGRLLSRREALTFLGIASAAMLASCAPGPIPTTAPLATSAAGGSGASPQPTSASGSLPACVVRPAMTEGPFFVDEKLNRSDVRPDPSDGSVKEGVPLKLAFRVSKLAAASCAPLAGAWVDIWHCDAQGVYSDVENATGKKFLRGYQVTDTSGLAQFTTIYPGWYQGRATHIHFKIRNDPSAQPGFEFTSQLFFDDALNNTIYKQQPYAPKGPNPVRNPDDGIYQGGGSQLLLKPTPDGEGYAAMFDIGLQMS